MRSAETAASMHLSVSENTHSILLYMEGCPLHGKFKVYLYMNLNVHEQNEQVLFPYLDYQVSLYLDKISILSYQRYFPSMDTLFLMRGNDTFAFKRTCMSSS